MPQQSTRDLIIDTSDRLFYEGGFAATSFADIAGGVGISRGNFYHHFKTKDDILDAVLVRRNDRVRAMLEGWQMQGQTPQARILAFVHMLIDNRAKITAHGCPVGTMCSELAKLDHAAQGDAAQIMLLFRDWLQDQFAALGAGERAPALALQLLTWSQGAAVMAQTFRNETFLRDEVARAERWLANLPLTDDTL